MTDFSNWCTVGTLVPIGDHQAGVLESYDDAKGVVTLAAGLPNTYAESDSLAKVAERFGKEGVAKFLCNKFPTKVSARSGDMGEILATAYLHEECGYVVGPSRLIQRDHQGVGDEAGRCTWGATRSQREATHHQGRGKEPGHRGRGHGQGCSRRRGAQRCVAVAALADPIRRAASCPQQTAISVKPSARGACADTRAQTADR